MGQALYRKYRSRSLDEIVGQPHITKTLHNAIKSGKISHAYLLTGPRGVGKTSIARVLAYAVNDLPYSDQAQLDIIEIDAASNRRIDEVRDLRDKVHILPTSAKYKVYIIDEVHMLTREAFNALLKTLEEPPAHVIFILATTEAHKLPETIISRTQHFSFKPIDVPTLKDHLKMIAKAEKITIDEPALELIAQHGNGSFRDSISFLDQIRSSSEAITAQDVQNLLGIAPDEQLKSLLDAITHGTTKTLLDLLIELKQKGISASAIASQLGQLLRDDIIAGKSANTTLLKDLLTVSASSQPEMLLEIVLLDALFAEQGTASVAKPVSSVSVTIPEVKPAVKKTPKASVVTTAKLTAQAEAAPATVAIPDPPKTADTKPSAKTTESPSDESFSLNDWPAVLASIKKQYNTLYGILRMAEPSLDANVLTLTFRFAFHEKQLKDATKRALVTSVIKELFGAPITIECILIAKGSSPSVSPAIKNNDAVDTVSNIFGGAEVLES